MITLKPQKETVMHMSNSFGWIQWKFETGKRMNMQSSTGKSQSTLIWKANKGSMSQVPSPASISQGSAMFLSISQGSNWGGKGWTRGARFSGSYALCHVEKPNMQLLQSAVAKEGPLRSLHSYSREGFRSPLLPRGLWQFWHDHLIQMVTFWNCTWWWCHC